MEKIRPIVLKDTENGDAFTLEFSRESVKFAEDRGFNLDDLMKFPMSKIPEFFFYAFRMHHRNLSRQQTDHILFDVLGGVPDGMLERLGDLYSAPFEALVAEDSSKNSKMTIEM